MKLSNQRMTASREDIIRTSKSNREMAQRLQQLDVGKVKNLDPMIDRYIHENFNNFGEKMKSKIRINEVKYGRRYNLGNFEHEDIIVNAAVEEGTFGEVINELKSLVSEYKSEQNVENDSQLDLLKATQTKAIEPELKEEPKKEKKKTVKKETKAPVDKKEKKVVRKGKSKIAKYDRNSNQHKELLGNFCEELFGENWKNNKATLSLVKQASVLSHQTQDFLDADGEILDSFKEVFKELVNK